MQQIIPKSSTQSVLSSDTRVMQRFFCELGLDYTNENIPQDRFGRGNWVRDSLDEMMQVYKDLKERYMRGEQVHFRLPILMQLEEDCTPLLKEPDFPLLSINYINETFGHGCFAQEGIEKDTLIGEYTGVVNTEATILYFSSYRASLLPHPTLNPLSFHNSDLDFHLEIDARKCGNEMRFINHAPIDCDIVVDKDQLQAQNVRFHHVIANGTWHALIVAMRDIKAGEELRMDYGPMYFRNQLESYDCFRLEDNRVVPVETRKVERQRPEYTI